MRVPRHKNLSMGRPQISPSGYRPLTRANSAIGKGLSNVFPPPARSKQTTLKAAHDSREGQDPITPSSPGPCQAASPALPCTCIKWPSKPQYSFPRSFRVGDHPAPPPPRAGGASLGASTRTPLPRVPGTGHRDEPALRGRSPGWMRLLAAAEPPSSRSWRRQRGAE